MNQSIAPESRDLVGDFNDLTKEGIRQLTMKLGAADAGVVSIDNPDLAEEKKKILENFPYAKTLISFVVKMNQENVRTPARSVANRDFHLTIDETDHIGRKLAQILVEKGIQAVSPSTGFPMEAEMWPGRIWVISHKPIAVAAGLGKMGIHRNVIHPKFGNFILLGKVVTDLNLEEYSSSIDFNPCFECKLCVAVCPTGAISPDGNFNFSACYTHNYREFMGGFGDWVEQIAGSKSSKDYRNKFTDTETVSIWQSLSFGPQYKAAYCVAVCPAGEDIIGSYQDNKKDFLKNIVNPLQNKNEIIYVTKNSDAVSYVNRRFPNKKIKYVGSGLRPCSIDNFLSNLPHIFQRGQAKGLNATYHFNFKGADPRSVTIKISNQKLSIQDGLIGSPNFRVTVYSQSWIDFLNKKISLPHLIITGNFRFWGNPKLLLAFEKCFPV